MSVTADSWSGPTPPVAPGPDAPAGAACATCQHCDQPLRGRGDGTYCCRGCRAVAELLEVRGLTRYYDLRPGAGTPVGELGASDRVRNWLEPLEAQVAEASDTTQLTLDVQGIRCAACVWLLDELFRRQRGAVRCIVNPSVGRVSLDVDPEFPLRDYVADVERFGYRLGPPLKDGESAASDDLLLRLGVCVALAGNTMLFAAAMYLGLERGRLHSLMLQLSYAMAAAAVLVGGSVFLRSAFEGLRRRVLHLDTPIALGILLSFAGSSWSFFAQEGRSVYFDSVTVFIALMLLGRYLQERVLAKNRLQLLSSAGTDGLLARRIEGGRVELVEAKRLEAGDELLIAPGDVVPVPGKTAEAQSFSLDWINGESVPRSFAAGAQVPAGAFNVGHRAARLTAQSGLADSALVELLRRSPERDTEAFGQSSFFQRFAGAYVALVLITAIGGLAYWWGIVGEGPRAIEVATAVLVVTCPCAFGIATPLGYELVQAALRRSGLFIRRAGFLDRLRGVRRIVFDKTGTLTTGFLRLVDESPLRELSRHERSTLYALAAQSAHPKSLAVARAIDGLAGARTAPDQEPPGGAELGFGQAEETVGQGIEAVVRGQRHRLGSPSFAAPGEPVREHVDLIYSIDGKVRAAFQTSETLRPHAADELRRLSQAGYGLWILSGDAQPKVEALADTLGVPRERAVGGLSPREKAAWLEAHGPERTLMIGDGINDSLAVQAAICSGTPAVDRPFMPARSDFYFVTPGLEPIATALERSFALRRTVLRNVLFAVAYNVIAVALALGGFMQPWLAAILMPASSLLILGATSWSLAQRSIRWTS